MSKLMLRRSGMAQMQGRDGALLVLCVLSAIGSAIAATYVIGDEKGWGFAVNYQDWASKYKFSTSDILVFNYTANSHSVFQVSKVDYDSCSIVSPTKTYSSGLDKVPITSSNVYFICGVPTHCSQGMKVAISATSTPITPTSPSTPPAILPPSSGTPPVGTGTTPSTAAPSTQPGNSASSLQSGAAAMVLISAFLGTALIFLL